jgi:Protein of unknown function DUF2625
MTNEAKMLSPFITWSGGPAVITGSLVIDQEHNSLLSTHNGLTAFEGGLRLFGTTPGLLLPALQDWNKQESWRSEYGELIKNSLVFFAEDVFGNQFAFDGTRVVYFNAESGRASPFANSFSEWLSIVLEDPADTLQLVLYKNWLKKGGRLDPAEHLCPTYPFVVKADPPLHELYRVSNVEDMRYKGHFALQIKDVPDGTRIKIKLTD